MTSLPKTAGESAEWIVEALKAEASTQGTPLTEHEENMLRTSVLELPAGVDRMMMVPLNNKVVRLARGAMVRGKESGATCVDVRRGLRIPYDWAVNYNAIFESNCPWVLSGIMQNAILNNPMQGERRKWKSK